MNSYLVTGGAGFIGSNIVGELVSRGHQVRVLDNFLTGKQQNLVSFEGKIDLIEGDIRDLSTCRQAVDGIEYVLHQAALPSVPLSVEDPITTTEINVNGILNMLIASRDAGVKRFVFASSSSIYGDDSTLPKTEEKIGKPLSPYAVSKLMGEKYCQVFSRIYGLPTVSLRYFNVFGPRQDPKSQYAAVIPDFITKILRGKRPTIYGNGEQTRDFTYVSNVVEANILSAQVQDKSGIAFNLACGERTTVNELLNKINAILGTDFHAVYEDARPGDILHSYADISVAKKILGYSPHVSFEKGIRKTLEWYRDQE